jgi:pimeloyl-ACP methyl ester carboxylesterase
LHVIGHSLGAKLVVELLRQEAIGARRMTTVIIASALLRPSLIGKVATNRALNRFSLGLIRWKPLLRAQSRAMAFPSDEMRELFQAHVAQVDFAIHMRPLEAFGRYDHLPDGLDAIQVPTLAVCGEREPAAIRRSTEDIARLVPTAEAVVIDGADHGYPWKNSLVFNTLIRSWTSGAVLPKASGFHRLPR